MQTVKKINPKSLAGLYAFFLAISAFLMGLGIACANIAQRVLQGETGLGAIVFIIIFNILYGILVGLISALIAAVVGSLFGYVFAWLYNVCVRMKIIQGVTVELRGDDKSF
ncbi:hypothetical protein A2242_00200 [Candidatus Falkowbacteria bacterium RIFOXYA2_FULL_47_9]|uniref:DUF3566 domain-containing protein n=1 Tax=Candidatus Falkowbacteria bacterium RIFOXYA2_FULL_47_9 TaxID=1797995 RepID=A0A1F5SR58_9BACT|nr:MAG: hypothetical protein A2242_00200 [Candidatus Falkowbacteria bacterium RIFOXYA2_FULL_47_9]